LDKVRRAKPLEWGKYSTDSIVIKIMNNSLEENFYQERRRPESLQYFSNAVTKFEKNLLKTQID